MKRDASFSWLCIVTIALASAARAEPAAKPPDADDTAQLEVSMRSKQLALATYRAQHRKLDRRSRRNATWQEIERRLLANDGRYLRLAMDLRDAGVLFGVTLSGNALFADAGDEPVVTGGSQAPPIVDQGLYGAHGYPASVGYELFPAPSCWDQHDLKSEEIRMYERNTGRPIVASMDRKHPRSIWLASERCAKWNGRHNEFFVFVAVFEPEDKKTRIRALAADNPYAPGWAMDPSRGVRRLLRVKNVDVP